MKVYLSVTAVVLSAVFHQLTPLTGYVENFIVSMGLLACSGLLVLSHFDDKFNQYEQNQ